MEHEGRRNWKVWRSQGCWKGWYFTKRDHISLCTASKPHIHQIRRYDFSTRLFHLHNGRSEKRFSLAIDDVILLVAAESPAFSIERAMGHFDHQVIQTRLARRARTFGKRSGMMISSPLYDRLWAFRRLDNVTILTWSSYSSHTASHERLWQGMTGTSLAVAIVS